MVVEASLLDFSCQLTAAKALSHFIEAVKGDAMRCARCDAMSPKADDCAAVSQQKLGIRMNRARGKCAHSACPNVLLLFPHRAGCGGALVENKYFAMSSHFSINSVLNIDCVHDRTSLDARECLSG